ACWVQLFRDAPAAHFAVEELFACGARAVLRWRYSWAAEGQGHVRGVDVYRVRDGRVAEKLSYVKGRAIGVGGRGEDLDTLTQRRDSQCPVATTCTRCPPTCPCQRTTAPAPICRGCGSRPSRWPPPTAGPSISRPCPGAQ